MRMAVKFRGAVESSHFSISVDIRSVNPNKDRTGINGEEARTNRVQTGPTGSAGEAPLRGLYGHPSEQWELGKLFLIAIGG